MQSMLEEQSKNILKQQEASDELVKHWKQEAYKQAGKWKANKGSPPSPEKKTIKSRPLVTIQALAGRLERKMEVLTDGNLGDIAAEQSWTDLAIGSAQKTLQLFLHSLLTIPPPRLTYLLSRSTCL